MDLTIQYFIMVWLHSYLLGIPWEREAEKVRRRGGKEVEDRTGRLLRVARERSREAALHGTRDRRSSCPVHHTNAKQKTVRSRKTSEVF